MSLSPREEQALATLESALRADDPALAAALAATPPPWALVRLRHVVSLSAALLVLVVGTALLGTRPGILVTGVVTTALVVPWLLFTVRSVAGAAVRAAGSRPTPGRDGRRPRRGARTGRRP